jgi:hypothetical protein
MEKIIADQSFRKLSDMMEAANKVMRKMRDNEDWKIDSPVADCYFALKEAYNSFNSDDVIKKNFAFKEAIKNFNKTNGKNYQIEEGQINWISGIR